MINAIRSGRLLLALATMLAACSGKGPDVTDPSSNQRAQMSIVALDSADGSTLALLREPDGVSAGFGDDASTTGGRRVDAIFESFDRLYLMHRESASISVVDLRTRERVAEITGFGAGPSKLCGVAFSNLSQGWAVDHDQSAVFHFDAVNAVVVDTLPIEGRPTSIATVGDKVFVASQRPDGSGLVSVFRSNFTTYRIEHTFGYTSPIVYMAPTGSRDAMILVSAGEPGGKPGIYSIRVSTMQQTGERSLNAPALTGRIGAPPEYAALTRDNYLYLATDGELYRLDVTSSRLSATPQRWLEGSFDVIGVDYWTDLLYAHDRSSGEIRRLTGGGEELSPLVAPAPVSAIEFVTASTVQ